MVTGYNLNIGDNISKFEKYVRIGAEHLSTQKAKLTIDLQKYVIDGVAYGTKIEKDWFPEIDADIFISHSHIDERLAKGLAGWLYDTFGLNCFIDSCVWGYSDKLLEKINNDYSDKRANSTGGYIYDHEKCNIASKHVNIILMIALHKMIDKAEVTFLLNTNNSISKYADVYQSATYSPWIYSEIVCTEIVRKKLIAEYRADDILEHYFEKNQSRSDGFSAVYNVSLEHLKDINLETLMEWKKEYNNKKIKYPLDWLYKLTHEKQTKKLI